MDYSLGKQNTQTRVGVVLNEKFKASKYNHFVPNNDGKVLAFNAISCGLGEMDKENYEIYRKFVNGKITDYDEIPHDLFEKLKEGNFLLVSEKVSLFDTLLF